MKLNSEPGPEFANGGWRDGFVRFRWRSGGNLSHGVCYVVFSLSIWVCKNRKECRSTPKLKRSTNKLLGIGCGDWITVYIFSPRLALECWWKQIVTRALRHIKEQHICWTRFDSFGLAFYHHMKNTLSLWGNEQGSFTCWYEESTDSTVVVAVNGDPQGCISFDVTMRMNIVFIRAVKSFHATDEKLAFNCWIENKQLTSRIEQY